MTCLPRDAAAAPTSTRVASLLVRMTIEEKAGQLSCYNDEVRPVGALFNSVVNAVDAAMLRDIAAGWVGTLFNGLGVAGARRAQDAALRSRLRIPLIFAADIIHGHRTIFPVPLAEAAAFDPRLSERTARAIAREASAGGVKYASVDISDATLRGVHLPPFRAAFDAGAGATIVSLTDMSGVPATANRRLLTDLLRGELGFTGVAVSDYDADRELIAHGYAADDGADAARLAMVAGVDMCMQSRLYMPYFPALVARGEVKPSPPRASPSSPCSATAARWRCRARCATRPRSSRPGSWLHRRATRSPTCCSAASTPPAGFLLLTGQQPWSYDRPSVGRPARPAGQDQDATARWRDAPDAALYAFGHGLSYAHFAIGDIDVPAVVPWDGGLAISATLRNISAAAGENPCPVLHPRPRRVAHASPPAAQAVRAGAAGARRGAADRGRAVQAGSPVRGPRRRMDGRAGPVQPVHRRRGRVHHGREAFRPHA